MTATFRRAALAASLFVLLTACDAPGPDSGVALESGALTTTNGIAQNGIAQNGIAQNGIAQNGIAQNGMLTNGLAPGEGTSGLAASGLTQESLALPEFQAWFARDAAYSDMVMSYLIRCALPASATLAYTTESSAHSWTGNLGLAPAWGAGQAIPPEEQELVSACLAAHVNRYGNHVSISVRGVQAGGALVETTLEEEAEYTFREGCYFGNLFDGTGTWSGVDQDSLDETTTTPRGCVAAFGVATPCLPMAGAGRCDVACTRDPTGKAYQACTATLLDGTPRSFRAIHVALQPSVVFRCGDGTCQFTESAETCVQDCPQ